MEDLIDLYKNKEHKVVLNNIDEDNMSMKITEKTLFNFNLNASMLTNNENFKDEDSLLDKGISIFSILYLI